MSGPLPDPKRRRRNAPTIPTTALPAAGRRGRVPKPPGWGSPLGEAGRAWWAWAWKTPQAAGWASGHEVIVARRASLEDDLAAIGEESGKLGLLREMRELDDRLGLSPKGMAQLRWEIVATPRDADDGRDDDEVSKRREERRARLTG